MKQGQTLADLSKQQVVILCRVEAVEDLAAKMPRKKHRWLRRNLLQMHLVASQSSCLSLTGNTWWHMFMLVLLLFYSPAASKSFSLLLLFQFTHGQALGVELLQEASLI